jgi:hypothetical protein
MDSAEIKWENSALFYRATDAVTAWTSGVRSVVRSKLFSVKELQVTVNVLDLPHATVPDTEQLTINTARINHWAALGQWDEEAIQTAQRKAQRIKQPVLAGVCHCEAGLLASITTFPQEANPYGEFFTQAELYPSGTKQACLSKLVAFLY